MSLFNLAIASIVDANTGNGINHNFIKQFASVTPEYEQRTREIRANSVMAVIGKIKASFKQYIEDSRARAQDRHGTEQVLQMSDHLLKDIGLTPADLHGLRSGQITLKKLSARRESNRNQAFAEQPGQSSSSVNGKLRGIQSANQEYFELKKCA